MISIQLDLAHREASLKALGAALRGPNALCLILGLIGDAGKATAQSVEALLQANIVPAEAAQVLWLPDDRQIPAGLAALLASGKPGPYVFLSASNPKVITQRLAGAPAPKPADLVQAFFQAMAA